MRRSERHALRWTFVLFSAVICGQAALPNCLIAQEDKGSLQSESSQAGYGHEKSEIQQSKITTPSGNVDESQPERTERSGGLFSLERLPDWLIGTATFLLVLATVALVKATKQLAKNAEIDATTRKIEATAAAWLKMRPSINFPDLRSITDPSEIEKNGSESIDALRVLETYATCINSSVYDLQVFNRLSGRWYLRSYSCIEPYILIRRGQYPENPPYDEMMILNKAVKVLRASFSPSNAGVRTSAWLPQRLRRKSSG